MKCTKYIVVSNHLIRREPLKEFDTEAEAEEFIRSSEEKYLSVVGVSVDDGYLTSSEPVRLMARRILVFVHHYPTATFAELTRHLGEAARGDSDMTLHQKPNLVLWSGVSDLFIDAYNAIQDSLYAAPSHFMVYAMDGQGLTLPIATRLDHKTPHWVPMVLSIRTEEHQKEIADAVRRNEQREARRKKREAARAGRAA